MVPEDALVACKFVNFDFLTVSWVAFFVLQVFIMMPLATPGDV